MIDYDKVRGIIAKGLKNHLQVPVIRSNQNNNPPAYPFISYTITTLESQNKGTWQEYEDGTQRKAILQTWSISALSDDNSESVTLALKAREWLDRSGTVYLNDNDVIVQSVGGVTNRDNFLTVEYEYKNGFDCFFWLYDEESAEPIDEGEIKTVSINEQTIESKDYNELLSKRLDGVI